MKKYRGGGRCARRATRRAVRWMCPNLGKGLTRASTFEVEAERTANVTPAPGRRAQATRRHVPRIGEVDVETSGREPFGRIRLVDLAVEYGAERDEALAAPDS